MIDIDLSKSRPMRLGVEWSDQVLWDNTATTERIRGADLSAVARESARLRADQPDVDVVVDIDVVIAADVRAARAMHCEADEIGSGTLLYVGTPSGLASLIADIHALGIVDGAVLIPRTAGMADLIREAVLPLLPTRLQLPTREAHSA